MDSKFPKSKLGFQCIGPCYEANTIISHPNILEKITSNLPFCPTEGYKLVDRKTGEEEVRYYDECYAPIKNTDEIKQDWAIPELYFSCSHFLNFYYNINSFDKALDWIVDNTDKPIITRSRIMNCAWKSHYNEIKIIDDRLVLFYVEIIKKFWIKDIFPYVSKYIKIDGDNIKMSEKINVTSGDEKQYNVEKINYFLKKFVNQNTIYNFLDDYIGDKTKIQEDIEKYKFYDDIIKNSFKNYIISKIKNKFISI